MSEEPTADQGSRGFREAIEAAGHAIFITDTSGEITYVNPAFEEITGYSSSEAIGERPSILKSGEMGEKYYQRLWRTILSGEVWEELVINRRKSGELYYAHQTIAPVLDENGNPVEFVALQTDTTELRASRQGIQKLGRILRHDLRNELSVVRSYAELIERQGGEGAEYATKIVETISSLLETSEKGIKLQRFLSQTHRPVPIDVRVVVATVISNTQEEFPEVQIAYAGPDTATALCLTEIEAALGEIVENAIIHNDSEKVRVNFSIEQTEHWIEIRITDNGPGLPEMEYAALDSPGSDLYHDTGFGLNLAYWIVRRSGGSIEFENGEDDGTSVLVRLSRPRE